MSLKHLRRFQTAFIQGQKKLGESDGKKQENVFE